MFHLLTNFGSLDATANQQINALSDDVIPINGNNQHAPADEYDMFARLGLGAQLGRARDTTPSIAQWLNSYFSPIEAAAIAGENQLVEEFAGMPIRRRPSEGISYQVTNLVAGPTATYVFSWIRKSFHPAPTGQILRMRGTSTTAAVANTWTTLVTAWEPQLQSGVYAVVGGQYFAATGIAFSIIFNGQFLRPGGLGQTTEGVLTWPKQINGGLGLWGTFPINAMPVMRVLNGAAVAVHTFYLDLVRLA